MKKILSIIPLLGLSFSTTQAFDGQNSAEMAFKVIAALGATSAAVATYAKVQELLYRDIFTQLDSPAYMTDLEAKNPGLLEGVQAAIDAHDFSDLPALNGISTQEIITPKLFLKIEASRNIIDYAQLTSHAVNCLYFFGAVATGAKIASYCLSK